MDTYTQLSISLLLILAGFAIGWALGLKAGEKIWRPSIAFHRAIWKQMYINLFNEVYPNTGTALYLTHEEVEALARHEREEEALAKRMKL